MYFGSIIGQKMTFFNPSFFQKFVILIKTYIKKHQNIVY